ncbi:hypothetical protein, partial [Nostocoides veronense]|uniref:hypothetical protein n=1 Tax=Nostocoides veronense TaxID=330836 RepID=UPI0031D259B8
DHKPAGQPITDPSRRRKWPKSGYTVVGAKGSLVRNPNLATQMTLLNLSCKLRIELGLSPAAALKLPAPTKGGVGAALAEEEAAFD